MQFSTGGKLREPSGRIGEIPIATVKVWMEEVVFLIGIFVMCPSEKTCLEVYFRHVFFVLKGCGEDEYKYKENHNGRNALCAFGDR